MSLAGATGERRCARQVTAVRQLLTDAVTG